jgi:hypothetical protein
VWRFRHTFPLQVEASSLSMSLSLLAGAYIDRTRGSVRLSLVMGREHGRPRSCPRTAAEEVGGDFPVGFYVPVGFYEDVPLAVEFRGAVPV